MIVDNFVEFFDGILSLEDLRKGRIDGETLVKAACQQKDQKKSRCDALIWLKDVENTTAAFSKLGSAFDSLKDTMNRLSQEREYGARDLFLEGQEV